MSGASTVAANSAAPGPRRWSRPALTRHGGPVVTGWRAAVMAPDRGRLRVGVDHVRHGLVAGLARLAEDVRGDDLSLVLADLGQQPRARPVRRSFHHIHRWVMKLIPVPEEAFRKRKRKRGIGAVGKSWRLDETYIKIRGEDRYWYRALGKQGNTVDFLLTAKRDSRAAQRFFTRRQEQPPPQDRQHRQERREQRRNQGLQ
jgi:hypothetical protein